MKTISVQEAIKTTNILNWAYMIWRFEEATMVRYVKATKGEALAIRKALPFLCPHVEYIEGMLDSSEAIQRWNFHKMKGANSVPRVRRC